MNPKRTERQFGIRRFNFMAAIWAFSRFSSIVFAVRVSGSQNRGGTGFQPVVPGVTPETVEQREQPRKMCCRHPVGRTIFKKHRTTNIER